MTDRKKSFILYYDQQSTFEALDDNEAGELIKTIFKEVQGQDADLTFNGRKHLQMALIPILETLKRNAIKYEEQCKKNKENAIKRWENEKQKMLEEYGRNHLNSTYADSDSNNDNDSESNSVSGSDSNSDNILLLNEEIVEKASNLFGY